MVELFQRDIKSTNRQSSKGNQLKWENSGTWYKADYTGYEGLAEYVIAALLGLSTLDAGEFVIYEPTEIKYKDTTYRGVSCKNFLKDDWQIITLERLFKALYGESLNSNIYKMDSCKNRLEFLVDQVEKATGLRNFGRYMNKLFTIDALFLNEDRHMHNIGVLMNGIGEFAYCPIFDNGAGLMADTTMDYPINGFVDDMIKTVKAKTISTDFDEQLDVSEELFGTNIKFTFSRKNVFDIISRADIYSLNERERVEKIVLYQMRKYQYLFKTPQT